MKQDEQMSEALGLLEAQVKEWEGQLSPEQLALLCRYAELLCTYTEANVIGSREIRSVVLDHVLDSLSCLNGLGVELSGKIIDVGSGGGLPGIPLAIARETLEVGLLEATRKKVTFLEHAREDLKLPNVRVLNARAEDAGIDKAIRDNYDFAVARALASLPVVLEYCAPFVRKGGLILAMKGRLEEDELVAGKKAATKIGAEFYKVARVHLRPELEQKQRHLVIFRKIASTPGGYPRRVGLAKKRPLGN